MRAKTLAPLLSMALAVNASDAAHVSIAVRDSETGFSLPATVDLVRPEGRSIRLSLRENGRAVEALDGTFTVRVSAEGHVPLVSRLAVEPEGPREFEFLLDPLLPSSPSSSRVQALLEGGNAVFHGFVRDEETGRPLPGVRVAAGSGGVTFSDARGAFALALPIPPSPEGEVLPPRESLTFTRDGFVSEERTDLFLAPDALRLQVALRKGEGRRTTRNPHRHLASVSEGSAGGDDPPLPLEPRRAPLAPPGAPLSLMVLAPPASIRVGSSCPTKTTCSTVTTLSLDTYVADGLDNEWIASWAYDSLYSGSIAYRSYGAWHVANPLTGTYDICNTTSCQVWDSSASARSTTAATYTAGFLVETGGAIARAEYSAENNNAGCGDCFSGTGTSWPCISDPHGCGKALNGHGRGMCQWGTQDRASTYGQSWPTITNAYYNPGSFTLTTPVSITSVTPMPATISAGGTFTIQVGSENASSAAHDQILIGASLCPGGMGCGISDPLNDAKVTVPAGAGTVSRPFQVPAATPPGVYDLLVAFWFDVNGDNAIQAEPTDLVLVTFKSNGALTVTCATDAQAPAVTPPSSTTVVQTTCL